MTRQPKPRKKPRREALLSAAVAAAIFYGLGVLATGQPAWFTDPFWWWMWLLIALFVSLIYYQTRNDLL